MLHHYATKQDLIASVIDYTVYKRMGSFSWDPRAQVRRIDEMARSRSLAEHAQREFGAYLELAIAARTDPTWRNIPAESPTLRQTELAEIIRPFEWADDPEGYA
jgi:hypothetical protein